MDNNAEACPMPSGDMDEYLREKLGKPRTVAVVGMSPKTERPSNEVGLYLKSIGFTVIPIHPMAKEIGGLKVYPTLESLPEEFKIDIVDLFVAGNRTMEAVEQAARIGAKCIWFQPGTENPDSEKRAKDLGLEVVSGRCTLAEHKRLFG